MRQGRMTRWLVLGLLAVVVVLLTMPTMAGAQTYLRDFQAVQGLTPSNSMSVKSLQVGCPSGKSVIGAGASVPLISNLALDRIWVASSTSVIGGAAETDSESATWALTDRVFCATVTDTEPADVQGASAPFVKQLSYDSNATPSNSNGSKSVVANCPAGHTAIGGGGNIVGKTTDVGFDGFSRLNAGGTLRIRAHEVDATNTRWSLEAHVICANLSSVVTEDVYASGLFYEIKTSPQNSLHKSAAVGCPAGKVVVGGGAQILGPSGTAVADVALSQSRPVGNPADAWLATGVETDPTAASWYVQVRAVCTNRFGKHDA